MLNFGRNLSCSCDSSNLLLLLLSLLIIIMIVIILIINIYLQGYGGSFEEPAFDRSAFLAKLKASSAKSGIRPSRQQLIENAKKARHFLSFICLNWLAIYENHERIDNFVLNHFDPFRNIVWGLVLVTTPNIRHMTLAIFDLKSSRATVLASVTCLMRV